MSTETEGFSDQGDPVASRLASALEAGGETGRPDPVEERMTRPLVLRDDEFAAVKSVAATFGMVATKPCGCGPDEPCDAHAEPWDAEPSPVAPEPVAAATEPDAALPDEPHMNLLESAWGVIANAGWDDCAKTTGWQEAAVRWRDDYHRWLDLHLQPGGYQTWEELAAGLVRERDALFAEVSDLRRAAAAPPGEPLSTAQCDRLRQMAGEWGDALTAVKAALGYAAQPHAAPAEIRDAAWDGLRMLEGSEEADHG